MEARLSRGKKQGLTPVFFNQIEFPIKAQLQIKAIRARHFAAGPLRGYQLTSLSVELEILWIERSAPLNSSSGSRRIPTACLRMP